jgi:hypothetical protein
LRESEREFSPASPNPTESLKHRLNVAEWNGRFSKFIQESSYRLRYAAARALVSSNNGNSAVAPPIVTEALLKRKWSEFIQSLEIEGKSFLVSHLQMCEIDAIEEGKVKLKCVKNFSFEALQGESAELNAEARRFFGGMVEIDISLDKIGFAEARRGERSADEIFIELSKTNEIIKFLIEHFGAEPLY